MTKLLDFNPHDLFISSPERTEIPLDHIEQKRVKLLDLTIQQKENALKSQLDPVELKKSKILDLTIQQKEKALEVQQNPIEEKKAKILDLTIQQKEKALTDKSKEELHQLKLEQLRKEQSLDEELETQKKKLLELRIEREEKELEQEAGTLPITLEHELLARKDALDSFKEFLNASTTLDHKPELIDETSTKEQIVQADARMLKTFSAYLMLGVKKIRTINDVSTMNRTLTSFIKERRAILGHPLKDDRSEDDKNKFLEAL